MLVKNLDHLFTDPKMEKSLLFTYDHAMDGGGRAPPVQGGFLLLTPSETKFEEMVEVVREGKDKQCLKFILYFKLLVKYMLWQ